MVDTSTVFKLLRSRNLRLIITFLYQGFKAEDQISVNQLVLVQLLEQYLEEQGYTGEEEPENPELVNTDLNTKARHLVKNGVSCTSCGLWWTVLPKSRW